MGWCIECEKEGRDPHHTRTVGEGEALCDLHRQRKYRQTEAGKATVKRSNDKQNPKRKSRSEFAKIVRRWNEDPGKEKK